MSFSSFRFHVIAAFAVAACAAPAGAQPAYSIVHAFTAAEGCHSHAPLIADTNGALYGTTYECAKNDGGTAFKLSPSPRGFVETTLHYFLAGNDGYWPQAGLVMAPDGTLFGSAVYDGKARRGVNFAVSQSGSGYRIINDFATTLPPKAVPGANPETTLVRRADGSLCGTTANGGSSSFGTIFCLVPGNAGAYALYTLHEFAGGSDGANPSGPLTPDRAGAFFGATSYGGPNNTGTVYEMTPLAKLRYATHVVYSFGASPDGSFPIGNLTRDAAGDLFGTTALGGSAGYGIAYELTPTSSGYVETVLHTFLGNSDGSYPEAGFVADSRGNLYGTTSQGGSTADCGTIYELVKAQHYMERQLHVFAGADGCEPSDNLLLDGAGRFFGTTGAGGMQNNGVVFEQTL